MARTRTVIDCPRANSDMTPCAARDGALACDDKGICVGCEQHPGNLLRDLVRKYLALQAVLDGMGAGHNTGLSVTRGGDG